MIFKKLYLSDKSINILGDLEDSDWDTPRPLKNIRNMLMEIIKEDKYYHYQLYLDKHDRSSHIGIIILPPDRFVITYIGEKLSRVIDTDDARKYIWGIIHYIQEGHYDVATD